MWTSYAGYSNTCGIGSTETTAATYFYVDDFNVQGRAGQWDDFERGSDGDSPIRAYGMRRPVLEFDISDFPANKLVRWARLILAESDDANVGYANAGSYNQNICLGFYRVTVAWTEGDGGSDDASWNHRDGTTHWDAAAGNIDTVPAYTATNMATLWIPYYCDPGRMWADVTALFNDARLNRSNILSIMMKQYPEEHDDDLWTAQIFHSDDAATAEYRPRIEVEYAASGDMYALFFCATP
jgi:hypothetical protein